MEIGVLISGEEGSPEPFTVAWSGSADVATLTSAITESLLVGDESWDLFSERHDTVLDRSALIGAVVAHGDRLRLCPRGETRGPIPGPKDAARELVVVGGANSGLRFQLGLGSTMIGRDIRSGIAIPDGFLSRPHAEATIGETGPVIIRDLKSANGTYIDGMRVDDSTSVDASTIVEMGRTLIAVRDRQPDSLVPKLEAGHVIFNRPPRMGGGTQPDPIRISAPPTQSAATRIQVGAIVLPVVFGIAMALILRQPFYLIFALLSPAMLLWNRVTEGRALRRLTRGGADEFKQRVIEEVSRLDGANADETRLRHASSPDAGQLSIAASHLTPLLWSRRPGDEDLLEVRIGWADQTSHQVIEIEEGGDEQLREWADQQFAAFRTVSSVPVTLPLSGIGVVGLSGQSSAAGALARWLIIQIATLHSPKDIGIYAIVPSEDQPGWEWLAWLPHTTGSQAELEQPTLAASPEAGRMVADALTREVSRRRSMASTPSSGNDAPVPRIVALIHGDAQLDRSTLQPVLAGGAAVGIHVIWIGSNRSALPGECDVIVDAGQPSTRLVSYRTGRNSIREGTSDGVSVEYAQTVAHNLAPIRDSAAMSLTTEVPASVPIGDVLELGSLGSRTVLERWNMGGDGLPAPVGLTGRGIFEIDLERDGPHGLVGGMTNSGKSEFLQTFVLALAARHSPARLNFVLVDYKGGTAFRDCVDLPHTIGFVTDLDGHLVDRALVSLNAEIKRRERILRDNRAKDLSTLRRINPDAAPPSLVIVIDEFYALATELPEFVDGMVDVASRGRALGVHLILATQRPDDRVVDENIRANANLRVALRVGADSDSIGVVGIPNAARIDKSVPGRAIIKTGHDEIVEVQTAFAGGRHLSSTQEVVTVRPRQMLGQATVDRHSLSLATDGPVDSARITAALRQTANDAGIPRQRSPWLMALGDVVTILQLDKQGEESCGAIIGLKDLPSEQRQEVWCYSFADEGNLLAYGSSGSGKTTLLRTFAASIALAQSPGECTIYALDFAAKGLISLAELPQCGGVVTTNDTETVMRLMALLEREIGERKDQFAAEGVASIEEIKRARPELRLPRIVVLLDSYDGFASAMEHVDHGATASRLTRIVADGQSVGINFVITASRGASVPGSLAGLISSTLVLRMANEDEYLSLNVPREVRSLEVVPGRGFIKGRVETQIALLVEDPSALSQNNELKRIARSIVERNPGQRAPQMKTLPTVVERAKLPKPSSPFRPYLGVEDTDVEPIAINLEDNGLLIVGPPRSGRTTTLETLARSILAANPSTQTWLFAPRRTRLTELTTWVRSGSGIAECDTLAAELEDAMQSRAVDSPPIFVFIDDGEELTETAGSRALESIVRRSQDVGIRIVGAAEVQATHRAYGSWVSEVKKQKVGLLLTPDVDIDGDIFGVRLPRSRQRAFPPGRGFLLERGQVALVQVASSG